MTQKPYQFFPLIIILFIILVAALVELVLPASDMFRYGCYARVFWYGSNGLNGLPSGACQFLSQAVQFHTFPLEYPPLSLVVFSVPLVLPMVSYPLAFALTMAFFVGLIYWALLRYGPEDSAFTFAILLLLSAAATALTRFDIVPAGLTLLCLILADRKHFTLAYLVLGLGVLVKLYPIILLPLLFIAEQHQRGVFQIILPFSAKGPFWPGIWGVIRSIRKWYFANFLLFAGLVLGVTLLFGLLNFKGAVLGSSAYFLTRPFQTELMGGVLLWLASLFGVPVSWEFSFGSLNILSPIGDWVSQGSLLVFYASYLAIVLMLLLKKIDLKQAFLASLFIGLTTSKIFSPQYMIWLVPVLAYNRIQGKLWWYLWGGISLLTAIIYPGFYAMVTSTASLLNLPHIPGFLQVIASRNELFVFITLAYLFNWFNLRNPKLVSAGSELSRSALPSQPQLLKEDLHE